MPASPRRLIAPEVIQTSKTDCGPAALKSMLEGFGISVSYARLREVCRTDVDGTSVDRLEQIANELGLDAEQVMVPVDHVLQRPGERVEEVEVGFGLQQGVMLVLPVNVHQ